MCRSNAVLRVSGGEEKSAMSEHSVQEAADQPSYHLLQLCQ